MDGLTFSVAGFLGGGLAWVAIRSIVTGFYTVNPNERAVKTRFGRAERLQVSTLDNPMADTLRPDERERYKYPQVKVIQPGGPYFRWPWERVEKVNVATQTVELARDPEDPNANRGGTMLDAVTKDQLNIGLIGQIRFRASEQNLYPVLFGIKRPMIHVLAYFISVLRQKIASFDAPDDIAQSLLPTDGHTPVLPGAAAAVAELSKGVGVSINHLRKNLRRLNEDMDKACQSSAARYGITLDASLITGIDPPHEVESALAAINTAYNQVGAEVSLAQASADQKIVQSRRAVEIETLNAQAEVEPLLQLAEQLDTLTSAGGKGVLTAYVRNVKLALFARAREAFLEVKR